MDDSNNLNPNNNVNSNPTEDSSVQGQNSYPNTDFDSNSGVNPNTGFDPNSEVNAGFDTNSGVNLNAGFDPNNGTNINANFDTNDGINPNMGFVPDPSSDPYASLNPTPFNPNMDSNDNSNVNDFNNQSTVNPILSQNISSDNSQFPQDSSVENSNMSYDQNNFADSNMNYQDNSLNSNIGYEQNNFNDPNMNYQDNNLNSNMGYEQNNFNDSNMNYQDNSLNSNMGYEQNNFTDPNMNYQDNSFNSNMGYDQNNFNDPNMNYQDNNLNSNIGYEQNNFTNPNMNSDSVDYNTDFVKNWMGTLYDKAHSKKFNWPAALFGGIYFLYRKMYLTGILFALLNLLVYSLLLFLFVKIGPVSFALMSVASIIFILIYGFSFYPLYRNFVRNKLKKYKQSITDNSQLLNAARSKGNTSVVAVIVYCIVAPIIISIIGILLIGAGIFSFGKDILDDAFSNYDVNEISQTQNATSDIQSFSFTDGYALEYDSLVWFLDEENKTLTKGDYSLLFAQTIPNISTSFNSDVTSPSGRSTLLGTLLSSLESQAAALNLSVESGVSNFVMQTNAFYAYIDIIATDNISRYYFILLPDDDLLFQFALTVNDTTVDYETNLEAINILTSIYKDENNESPNDNEVDESNIVEDANALDENITNENSANVVDSADTNSVSNDVADRNATIENSISNDVVVSENISNISSDLADVLN